MGERLTERDLAILAGLAGSGFLTFSQIGKTFFTGRAKATIHNRLTALERRGLLVRRRVGRVFHRLEAREIGVIFQPTKAALRIVQELRPEMPLKDDPVAIAHGDLMHDLILHDVLVALARRFPGLSFHNTKTLPRTQLPAGHLPDGLAWAVPARRAWAIELELSGKSERRYRQILAEYRVNPIFERVLYLCAARPIEEKVISVLAHRPQPGLPPPETGKFYFADLKSFLRDPLECQFSNGRNELRGPIEPNLTPEKGVLHEP